MELRKGLVDPGNGGGGQEREVEKFRVRCALHHVPKRNVSIYCMSVTYTNKKKYMY